MELLSSWAESLQLFTPAKLAQSGYLMFRAVYFFVKNMILERIYLFFLVLSMLIMVIANVALFSMQAVPTLATRILVGLLLASYASYVLLGLRPSVMLKDTNYFFLYAHRAIGYIIFIGLICGLLHWYTQFPAIENYLLYYIGELVSVFAMMPIYAIRTAHLWHIYILSLSPVFVFIFLFCIDARPTYWSIIWSVWRGIKICIYNYPSILIIYGLAYMLVYIVHAATQFLLFTGTQNPLALYFGIITVSPLYYAVLVNIYIQNIHERYELYY